MNTELLIFLMLFISGFGLKLESYIDNNGLMIDHHVGNYLTRNEMGNLYRFTYDVHMLGEAFTKNLDDIPEIRKVYCDGTGIRLSIEFTNIFSARTFVQSINSNKESFVVSSKHVCSKDPNLSILIRRVFIATVKANYAQLETSIGHYEEIIKDGSIKLEPEPEEENDNFSEELCFKMNSKENCVEVDREIPFVSGCAELICKNCFMGLKGTLFFEITFSLFKLVSLKGGIKNAEINGAFVLKYDNQKECIYSFEEDINLMKSKKLFDARIGFIPMSVVSEIPAKITTELNTEKNINVELGMKMEWKPLDLHAEWSLAGKWTHSTPSFIPKFHEVLSTTGEFESSGGFTIEPSLKINFVWLADMALNFNAGMSYELKPDSNTKKACIDVNCSGHGTMDIKLRVNIDLTRLKDEGKQIGMKLFDVGTTEPIHYCLP